MDSVRPLYVSRSHSHSYNWEVPVAHPHDQEFDVAQEGPNKLTGELLLGLLPSCREASTPPLTPKALAPVLDDMQPLYATRSRPRSYHWELPVLLPHDQQLDVAREVPNELKSEFLRSCRGAATPPFTPRARAPAVNQMQPWYASRRGASNKLTSNFLQSLREVATPPLTPKARGASSPHPRPVDDEHQQHGRLIMSLGAHLETVGRTLSAYGSIQSDARSGDSVLQPGTLQALRGTLAALISGNIDTVHHPRPPHIGKREVDSTCVTVGSQRLQKGGGADGKQDNGDPLSADVTSSGIFSPKCAATFDFSSINSHKDEQQDPKRTHIGQSHIGQSLSGQTVAGSMWKEWKHLQRGGSRDVQGMSFSEGLTSENSRGSCYSESGVDFKFERTSSGGFVVFPATRRMGAQLAAVAFGDSVVAVVIIAYAGILGVSADVKWHGWQNVEYCFTAFFVVELLTKMIGLGPRSFFCGPDSSWNICDTVIVSIAVLDSSLFLLILEASDTEISNLYIVRAVRLCRLARLLRLLRFSMFAELKTMISGVVSGLKVLAWAIILFFILLYVTAIMLRQLLGPGFELAESTEPRYDPELKKAFANMKSSINTLYMCFTGECNASDGSPLQVHIFDQQGFVFAVCAMLIMLFVTIGLFNLIMATFVDNVLRKGRQRKLEQIASQAKRYERRLRQLVKAFCESGSISFVSRQSSAPLAQLQKGCSNCFRWCLEKLGFELHGRDSSMKADSVGSLVITRERFRELLSEPLIEETMVQLEIETTSHDELFDVLDADMSGELDVEELIHGLMQLRGPPEKKDTIGSLLCIRATQAYLREGHHNIDVLVDRVLTALKAHTDVVLMRIQELRSDVSRGQAGNRHGNGLT